MVGKIRQAVVGLVAKTRQVVGGMVSKVGEWISGKPAVRPVVLKPVANRALKPVRLAYAVAALFVFGLMVSFSDVFAAAAVDAGVQEAADAFELTFTLVKGIALTILTFAVGFKLAKRWLK